MKEKEALRITIHHSPTHQETFFPFQHFKEMIRRLLENAQHPLSFPVVEIIPPEEQGGYLSLSAIAEATQELVSSPSDLLSHSIPHGILFSSFSTNRVLFSLNSSPEQTLLFVEGKGLVEERASCLLLQEQSEFLRQTILFSLEHPTIALHLAIPSLHGKVALLVRQGLLRELLSKNKKNQTSLIEDLQRFLLATDETFKELRAPEHLLKLIATHNFLREQQTAQTKNDKALFFKIFPSQLHFPFGSKDVLSLAVSIRSLSPYEHFDERHMLQACKRCLPLLETIPESFYTYSYAEGPYRSFYLELAKTDGTTVNKEELSLLKKELERELTLAIEHVVTRIDIPPNEDDVLRNILLLSQEIKNSKALPQVIIQFQGQNDTALNFHITVVRLIKEDSPPLLFPASSTEIVRFLPLTSSSLGKLRNKYQKESVTCLVQCSKEAFLRHDHSIDFLKAREAVLRAVVATFGEVRDLNGGLIYQQNKLLENVRNLLAGDETKELFLVEKLFHSLSPSIMKNLLGPEHILTVFRQLRSLRKMSKEKSSQCFLKESYEKESFFGFICPDNTCGDDILCVQEEHLLEQDQLAIFQVEHEGLHFFFAICLHPEAEKRAAFVNSLELYLSEKQREQNSSSLLRISLPRPTLVLDPRLGTDKTSSTVIKMLYEGLMRLGPQGIPTHAIADEVRTSDNGKKYTFNLRSTCWSNGQPLTAHDFEYAWKKILDPSFKTTFHYFFHPIKNAQAVKEGKLPLDALGVTAASDNTLVIELERPTPYFLELCCLWIYSPLCKDVDKARPGWAYYGDKSYACNGPFKLQKWSKQTGVHVVKNEFYWDQKHVGLDKIDISIIEDSIQAIKMFEEGSLDWIGEPLSEVPANIIKQKHLSLHSQPLSAVQWYFLNTQKSPFCSQKVRHAFSYALDRSSIIRECLYGDEQASKSVLPASMSLLDSEDSFPFNPDLAKKLFDEGLLEQGIAPYSIKTIKMVINDEDPHRSVAHAVARYWEKAFGISTIIDAVGWQEFFEKTSETTYDVIACAWHSWFRDPLYSFELLQSPSNSLNASKWENPAFSSLVEKAGLEEKKETRNALLKEAEILLHKEMPIIPLFEYNSRYMKSPAVDHIYVSHMGSVDFKWATCTPRPSSCLIHRSMQPEEIRLYLRTEPSSLDPRMGGSHFSQLLLVGLFEGLMRRDRDGNLSPGLAETYSISDDGLTYTFTLRPAAWSNADPITASDFEKTWKELLHPLSSIPSFHTYTLFLIRNAKKAYSGELHSEDIGIRALDDKTLIIELEHPAPYFLELLANPFFAPMHKSHIKDTDWSTKSFPEYISNGPFVLKERQQRSFIVLEKNPLYWDQKSVASSRIRFTIIEDPRVAHSLFKAGELDWYGGPFGNPSLESIKDNSTVTHREIDGLYWLYCRTSVPHLSSVKIRKALAMAIHREEICEALGSGEGPARSLVVRSASLLSKPVFEDNQPDAALKLFEEGLCELGYTKETYPIIIINYWDDPTAKTIAKMVQQQLTNRLNIHVEIAFQSWDSYLKKALEGDFHLLILSWLSWIHDPIYTLEHLKYLDSGLNVTGWTSPAYTHALDLAETTTDPKKRDFHLLEAETIVLQELPLIPIIHKTFTYMKAPELSGEKWFNSGLVGLQWLKREKRHSLL